VDTDQLLEFGAQGIHLLFDRDTITEAFGQDADQLREAISGHSDEVHFAIQALLSLPTVDEGRRFMADLSPAIRHIVVLLYFELLDSRLRRAATLH